MKRLIRPLIASIGLALVALIGPPIASALAVDKLGVSPASALGNLGTTTAGACWLRSLKWGSVWFTDPNTRTFVQENVVDWFNGCAAGNISITAACSGRCGYERQGSFWDAGRGANTDWVNFQTYGLFWEPECVWLRFWTRPNGTSYWASGESFGWC